MKLITLAFSVLVMVCASHQATAQNVECGPDAPCQSGWLWRIQTGHAGLFYNCDCEEAKRHAPCIFWNCNHTCKSSLFSGMGSISNQIREVKQRIRWGGCGGCQSCGGTGRCRCQTAATGLAMQGPTGQPAAQPQQAINRWSMKPTTTWNSDPTASLRPSLSTLMTARAEKQRRSQRQAFAWQTGDHSHSKPVKTAKRPSAAERLQRDASFRMIKR